MSQRFGRYELLRPLGRGGMAEVFLARYVGPEGFEKRLVIKRILPKFGDDQRLLRMFFEEARTHVSLSHGNLVSVFDFGRVENDYFIAMEHVRGADLNLLLSACRVAGAPLPPAVVAYIGQELCRGLAYVHRQGFVHRDLSPRNVLLSIDGEVKLSDFGLVLRSAGGEDAAVRGTLAYVSPEQARGERVDGRSDLFSLGCVLAEALLGTRVRETSNDEEALALARRGDPIILERPLGAVIARATQTNAQDRYASADEMLAALEREAQAMGVGREASVRELAARIADIAPASDPTPAAEPAERTAATDAAVAATAPARRRVSSRAETYYRGNESAAIVDEVLGRSTRARRRLATVVVVGAGIGTLALMGGLALHARAIGRGASRAPDATASDPQTPPAAPKVAGPTTAPITPAPANAPTLAADTRSRARTSTTHATPAHHAVAPAPAAIGTVHIQCSPWCIPFVDGTQRGPDRKNHTLTLPAGRHVVVARRLDDRLERAVRVDPNATVDVDFTFR